MSRQLNPRLSEFVRTQQRSPKIVRLMGLVVLFSLVVPPTREVHVLTARLLLHLRTGNTYVQGQPPGCVIYHVPNVHFQSGYLKNCRERASKSAEDFVFASGRGSWSDRSSMHVKMPPRAHWRNHPLLGWAAIEQAAWICASETHDPGHRRALATGCLAGEANKDAINALDLLHDAQQANPENGALWLAEACVHEYTGEDEAVFGALQRAIRSRRWDWQIDPATQRRRQLLHERGLPEFDAFHQASRHLDGASQDIRHEIAERLFGRMHEVLIVGDREMESFLSGLLIELDQVDWSNRSDLRAGLGWEHCSGFDTLTETLAQQKGTEVPSRGTVDSDTREKIQIELFREYLGRRCGTELADAVVDHDPLQLIRRRESLLGWRELRDRMERSWLRASAAGALTLLLLASLGAGLFTELCFVASQGLSGWDPRWLRRLMTSSAVIMCLIGAVGAVASAHYALVQPVGLGSRPYAPPLSPLQQAVVAGMIATALLVAARLLTRSVRRYFVALLFVLTCGYLLASTGAAYYRRQALNDAIECERMQLLRTESQPSLATLPTHDSVNRPRRA